MPAFIVSIHYFTYNNLTMKRGLLLLLILVITFPINSFKASAQSSFDPDFLLSDTEFTNTSAMQKFELDIFLNKGSLKDLITRDYLGRYKTASDIIWESAQRYNLNPQTILVLLQKEQSLIEDNNPSTDQISWAMGYAVCDDCSKSDPRIQKFKGFGNQVHYAAKRIRESYLTNLEKYGFTESGIGPDIEMQIDNTLVTPANFATSSLYTYTPHIHGNKNFVKIWNKWFSKNYLSGTLLQDNESGGIWLIKNNQRRPITSKAAFHTRFNSDNVIPVGKSTLMQYAIGAPIKFPNYSLLRSPRGTVYLIVDDKRRGFTSQEAFRALGFSPDEIIDVEWSDLDAYAESDPITTESVYPKGALLQDNLTGGVFAIENGKKRPIMSKEILYKNFFSPSIVQVTKNDLNEYQTDSALKFPDGTLVAAHGSPDIFVISNGLRHHIKDEVTFITYGWRWDQIIWTNERSVLLHKLSTPITTDLNTETNIEIANLGK